MLIPAITEAILALAAGSVAGVSKAIEFGLAKLITLVIGLFARLIGLGGLAKKVMKIFKKIKKRIGRAINKLMQKAKRAGRKIMRKLGLTKKTKGGEKNDPKKQAKIDKGLAFLNKEEKKYMEGGKITEEGSEKAAKATKSKHKVFTSFKVVDGKDSWDYRYTASAATKVEGEKKKDEDDLTIEVGTTFSIRPKKNWYSAVIDKVQKSRRTFDYKFDYEKYRAGLTRMKFSKWKEGIKNGTIATMPPNRRKKIMAEAKKHDEPLRGLIIGTLGGYRGNLISDLQELIKSEGGKTEFKNMYKNADATFRSKIDALIGKKPVTKSDFKELFKGFEAHHVIPANFLRNNAIVQELLKQPGIEFGYNNLDNLIFIPAENHTVGQQRGHPEYDKEISSRITNRVLPIMQDGDYPGALIELREIISEVKNKFINEIIGSEKTAKNA